MLITERHLMQPSTSAALQSALKGGAGLIQLREKDLLDKELLALARDFRRCCAPFQAQLVVNSRLEVAREIGAGLHLPESEVLRLDAARHALGDKVLIGASAHSLEAAQRAQDQGADYVLFGSVFTTQSHPGHAPAGLEMLREIAASVSIPVLAVGGITLENAGECLAAGAQGVAVIRAAWSTPDVEAATRALSRALRRTRR